MKNSLYIAKVFGIKIFIHWTFFILIIWIAAMSMREGNNITQTIYSVAFVLAIFFCVVLHELGHALTAKRFNYITKDIILLPIGGMARMDELPENPKQELLIAVAGPIVNIVIALLLSPFINWSQINEASLDKFALSGSNFLFSLFAVNISLAVFNLIPAFPMDGGRIFRAILSMWTGRVKATAIASRTGQFIAFIFFFLGILYNPFLALIGVFIFITAKAENEDVKSKYYLHNFKVKDAMSHHYYKLDKKSTIKDAAKLLIDVEPNDFLVTDNEKIVGTLNSDEIIKALVKKGENSKVEEAMNTKVKFISKDIDLDKVLKEFSQSNETIMPVMDNNTLIGTVNMKNILKLIMVNSAAQKHSETEIEEDILQS